MIAARSLSMWNGLVGSVALIAIAVLALCVMMHVVKLGDVLRHIGVIVGVAISLVILPATIAGLWSTMSFGQRLGITALCVGIVILFDRSQRRPTGARRR